MVNIKCSYFWRLFLAHVQLPGLSLLTVRKERKRDLASTQLRVNDYIVRARSVFGFGNSLPSFFNHEWNTEKPHECTNMGKVKRLEIWWQLYVTWLPVRGLENYTISHLVYLCRRLHQNGLQYLHFVPNCWFKPELYKIKYISFPLIYLVLQQV